MKRYCRNRLAEMELCLLCKRKILLRYIPIATIVLHDSAVYRMELEMLQGVI